ncbi:MAG TPA: hypothetical protein PK766_10150 [Bacteroidales bacterium]|nr:hypothetical protein [Bacteroidales bacterium]
MNLDDIKLYLPKYLTPESKDQLYESLKQFPESQDSRVYTRSLLNEKIIYQGDGIKDFLVIDLPNIEKLKESPCLILSNSCDLSPDNQRLYSTRIMYSPIVNLKKYELGLMAKHDKGRVESLLRSIRKQEPSQTFYLPELPGILEESFIFFDRTFNISNKFVGSDEIPSRRLFTLSNYGLYLFIIKLSIHFTRIQEGVNRIQNY